MLDAKGNPFMSIGAAGATRIITCVAQIIMNVVDHGMGMDAAIEAGRFHNQSGLNLRADQERVDEMVLAVSAKRDIKSNLSGLRRTWNGAGYTL